MKLYNKIRISIRKVFWGGMDFCESVFRMYRSENLFVLVIQSLYIVFELRNVGLRAGWKNATFVTNEFNESKFIRKV